MEAAYSGIPAWSANGRIATGVTASFQDVAIMRSRSR